MLFGFVRACKHSHLSLRLRTYSCLAFKEKNQLLYNFSKTINDCIDSPHDPGRAGDGPHVKGAHKKYTDTINRCTRVKGCVTAGDWKELGGRVRAKKKQQVDSYE